MNSKFFFTILTAIFSIHFGQCSSININQLYSIGKVLASDVKVVSKFGEIINLRNFYPLLSQFRLNDFLNCSAKQLENLASINSCWALYPQVTGLLNQTILENIGFLLDKAPTDALNELKSSSLLIQFLIEKNILNASECLGLQLLNPATPMLCLANYPQLTAFLITITDNKISTFMIYLKGFLADNFGSFIAGTNSKRFSSTVTFSTEYLTACLSSPNTACIQNLGIEEYFSSENIKKLNELIDLSEDSLQSAAISVPGEFFESLRSALKSLDENNDILIGNKSNLQYGTPSLFLVIFVILLIFN